MSDMQEITLTCPKCDEAFRVRYSRYAPEKSAKCSSCGFDMPLPQVEQITPLQPTASTRCDTMPVKKGSLFGRIIAGVVGGLILGTLAANIFNLVFADPTDKRAASPITVVSGILFCAIVATAIVVAVKSIRPAKAWRRLLIPSGILSLILPLAGLVTTSRMAHIAAAKGGQMAELEAGVYAVSGTFLMVLVGSFGIILAAIFLTIGLLVDREPRRDEQR